MKLFDFLRSGTPENRFGEDMVAALKRGGAPASIHFDKANFAIQMSEEARFNLHNAFRIWTDAPDRKTKAAEFDRLVAFGLSCLHEPDCSWGAVADLLLPAIRNRSYVDCMWITYDTEKPDHDRYRGATLPIGENYVGMLAINRSTGIQLVTAETIAEWGRSFAEVWSVALENLRAASPAKFFRTAEGFYISEYEDFFDNSRLLLPHLLEQLNLRGAAVVIPMSRTALLVAGADDKAALEAMAEFVVENFSKDQRPTGLEALVLQGAQWVAATQPEVERLRFYQRDWDYAEQKQMLEEYYQRTGRDVFVATFAAVEADDGRPTSWSSWYETVPTLLPRTDVIVLGGESRKSFPRRWEDVMEVCGPFEEEPGLYPPRYMTPADPTPAQREALLAKPRPVGFPRPENPDFEA